MRYQFEYFVDLAQEREKLRSPSLTYMTIV